MRLRSGYRAPFCRLVFDDLLKGDLFTKQVNDGLLVGKVLVNAPVPPDQPAQDKKQQGENTEHDQKIR